MIKNNSFNLKNKTILNISAIYFLFLTLVFLSLLFRYQSTSFVADSLWAEDGGIFFNGTSKGLYSLFEPYAGYLHLYPRIFAIIAKPFPFHYIPYIYFLGWIIAILIVHWSLRSALPKSRITGFLAFFFAILILLQPHGGETFLTLTNAQWWLAVALALVCCFPEKFGIKTYPIVFLLSLTGPFSFLYTPFILRNSFKQKTWYVLLIVLLGAFVQLALILSHPRSSQALDYNLHHWFLLLQTFISFGLNNKFLVLLSYVFWLFFVLSIKESKFDELSILGCALIVFAAAVYSLKGMPGVLSQYGPGSRYFVTPYSLVIIYLCFRVARKNVPAMIASFIAIIIFTNAPLHINKPTFYFRQYAQLSDYETDTLIPIAPGLALGTRFILKVHNSKVIESKQAEITIKRLKEDQFFVGKNLCEGYQGIGFVADGINLNEGLVRIEIIEHCSTPNISERYYEAGSQRIQLATKKITENTRMYLVLPKGSESVTHAKVICLK